MAMDERVVQSADYPALEKLSDLAIKEKQKFERILVSKEKLLEMFGVRFERHMLLSPLALTQGSSTTSTRSTSSSRRSLMVARRRYTAVDR